MPTQKLLKYFQEYEAYHTQPGNKVCHYIGIPSIMLSLLGLLSGLTVVDSVFGLPWLRIDGGMILLGVALTWYFLQDWRITIPWVFVSLALYSLGSALPTPLNWGIFVAGWVFQGIGHYVYEKKSPAFLKNLEHVLVGPLWIFARTVGYHRK